MNTVCSAQIMKHLFLQGSKDLSFISCVMDAGCNKFSGLTKVFTEFCLLADLTSRDTNMTTAQTSDMGRPRTIKHNKYPHPAQYFLRS
jgi:hypothetical protein